ncbi:MAG: hypothetical protein K1W02_14625 [Muribaculaceae bacterium]
MKKLTDFEMLSILGGWADPEECKRVLDEVPDMESNPDTTDEAWDKWAEEFYKHCGGIAI